MSFDFGKNIHLTIFGQSHSKAIGAVIEGLPAGLKLDMKALKASCPAASLARREPQPARRLTNPLSSPAWWMAEPAVPPWP